MTKAVIFDLDGLLVDTEGVWYTVFKEILESYGHGLTLEEYLANHSGKTIAENIQIIIEKYALPLEHEAGVKRAIETEWKHVESGVELKAGAKELLQYLKENHYKIALGTSSTRERVRVILKYHQIEHYFDDIVVGYDVKRGKPYPDTFLAASERVGEAAENCLVLEDSEAGIQAAYSAKIPVICIPDMKKPRKEYADMTEAILPSLFDVIDYLK